MEEQGKSLVINYVNYPLEKIEEELERNKEEFFPLFSQIETIQFLDDIGHYPEEHNVLWHVVHSTAMRKLFPRNGQYSDLFNEGFYVANKFNLGEWEKRISAIVALWNGRHNHFEWITYHGFDISKLLSDIGIVDKQEAEKLKNEFRSSRKTHTFLEEKIHDEIAKYFRLTNEDLMAAPLICRDVWKKENSLRR